MKSTYILAIGLLAACSSPKQKETADSETPENEPTSGITSLLGKPLPQKSMSDSITVLLEGNLKEAADAYAENPDSIDLAIWRGRRIAYLGRYEEAITFYSQAIEKFPDDHRLYRHRGHRYISTRQLDKAITDFETASRLALKVPNQKEPDGIPNKLNQPLGNDRFNIYYHHALALYLQGRYEEAIPVYQRCMAVSHNADLQVATSYWLYMALQRTEKEEDARLLLGPINKRMTIVENEAYLKLLLLFKGELSKEETFSLPDHPTYQYGVGMSYFLQGDTAKARKIWNKVLEHESWDSFGYLGAEAEISRL